jgi:hypothetical protein
MMNLFRRLLFELMAGAAIVGLYLFVLTRGKWL